VLPPQGCVLSISLCLHFAFGIRTFGTSLAGEFSKLVVAFVYLFIYRLIWCVAVVVRSRQRSKLTPCMILLLQHNPTPTHHAHRQEVPPPLPSLSYPTPRITSHSPGAKMFGIAAGGHSWFSSKKIQSHCLTEDTPTFRVPLKQSRKVSSRDRFKTKL
jgi:hypothetical protein